MEVARSASIVSQGPKQKVIGEFDALALRRSAQRRRTVIAVENQLVRLIELPQRNGARKARSGIAVTDLFARGPVQQRVLLDRSSRRIERRMRLRIIDVGCAADVIGMKAAAVVDVEFAVARKRIAGAGVIE